jgi:hypothetical protein
MLIILHEALEELCSRAVAVASSLITLSVRKINKTYKIKHDICGKEVSFVDSLHSALCGMRLQEAMGMAVVVDLLDFWYMGLYNIQNLETLVGYGLLLAMR